ncbi:hypothetical protein ACFLYK_03335 [Candidatus Cloacimonadota bacterium]
MKIVIIIFLAAFVLALNLSAEYAYETTIMEIELKGSITDRNSELSGLTWYKDNLILLPQYPNFPEYEGVGKIFYIHRNKLLEYIVGDVTIPLEPQEIELDLAKFNNTIPGFEGFEAILFIEDTVYLTIESEPDKVKGYIVRGKIAPDMSEIIPDSLFIVEIEPQADVPNACEESLISVDDKIISIYEANGKNINPHPVAHTLDLTTDSLNTIEFLNLEYRITDATEVDEKGRFWVINYFWPGEKEAYDPAADYIAEIYGIGETHSQTEVVERLVELKYKNNRITSAGTPPVILQLDSEGRNLEGLVRFEDLGFLICTDKFPKTILGFVPYSFE